MSSLILASCSPRRKEIMESLGFNFSVRKVDFDEQTPDDMPTMEVAKFLAKRKNEAVKRADETEIILTADTIVILHNQVLGKPRDPLEAKTMLLNLSGNTHKVITGVCISSRENKITFSSVTEVRFGPLDKLAIEYYVEKYKPFDKAGAYGIQEWMGQIGIEGIDGSYHNVVGLPSHEVYRTLTQVFSIVPNVNYGNN